MIQVADLEGQSLIEDREAYMYLLKMHRSIACCDRTFKNFVIQEFDPQKKALKVRPLSLLYVIS